MTHTFSGGDQVQIIEINFICQDFSGEIKPQESEVVELKWFDADDLPQNISAPDQKAFAAFAAWAKRQGKVKRQENAGLNRRFIFNAC